MRTFLIGLVIVVLALALRMAFVVAPAAGTFADLEEIGLAGCEALTIAPGTEDVTIHPVTGLALVSTAERRGGDSAGNAIWSFDPADPQASLTRLTNAPEDFVPHGISLLVREGDAWAQVGGPCWAEHRLHELEKAGFTARAMVDGSVTHACSKAGKPPDAERWFEKLKVAGLEADVASCSPITNAWAQAGKPGRAESWLQWLDGKRV